MDTQPLRHKPLTYTGKSWRLIHLPLTRIQAPIAVANGDIRGTMRAFRANWCAFNVVLIAVLRSGNPGVCIIVLFAASVFIHPTCMAVMLPLITHHPNIPRSIFGLYNSLYCLCYPCLNFSTLLMIHLLWWLLHNLFWWLVRAILRIKRMTYFKTSFNFSHRIYKSMT